MHRYLKICLFIFILQNTLISQPALNGDKNKQTTRKGRDTVTIGMYINSLTDLILQKLLRVKQIEDNKGKTIVSEGIDANYQDMINYSVFALILMGIGQ